MAPARMMQYADKHIINCETCQQDPELAEEIEKIRDFVLPESKIPKSKRDEEKEATPEISPDKENTGNDDNDTDTHNDDAEAQDVDEEV